LVFDHIVFDRYVDNERERFMENRRADGRPAAVRKTFVVFPISEEDALFYVGAI
jgi:hypothetical protein